MIDIRTYAPPSPLLKNRVDPSPKNRHGMGTMMYMSAAAQVQERQQRGHRELVLVTEQDIIKLTVTC